MIEIKRVWTYDGEEKVHYLISIEGVNRHLWTPQHSALGIELLNSKLYCRRVGTGSISTPGHSAGGMPSMPDLPEYG